MNNWLTFTAIDSLIIQNIEDLQINVKSFSNSNENLFLKALKYDFISNIEIKLWIFNIGLCCQFGYENNSGHSSVIFIRDSLAYFA